MDIPIAATIIIIPNSICMVCYFRLFDPLYFIENNMPHSKALR